MYAHLMDADHWFGRRRHRKVDCPRARSRRDHSHDAAWNCGIISRRLARARCGLVPARAICRFYLLYNRGDHYPGDLPPHSRPHRWWRPNSPRCITKNPGKRSARPIFFSVDARESPLGIQVPRGLTPSPMLTELERYSMLAQASVAAYDRATIDSVKGPDHESR